MPPRDQADLLEERLVRQVARTSLAHGVLAADDRLLVALSGGKDSFSLLLLLERLRRRLPFSIELIAVHVDPRAPDHDPAPLAAWLAQGGRRYEIVQEDLWPVVQRHARGGGSTCAVCSRLRRGVLYTTAARLGCNKVALGHHRDDALATLLLNLFYGGKLQALPARYTTDDGRLEVVRPLIEIAERDLERLARLRGCPVYSCRACAQQPDLQRAAMERLLADLERGHPQLRQVMLAALGRVRPRHLLDVQLLDRLRADGPGAR